MAAVEPIFKLLKNFDGGILDDEVLFNLSNVLICDQDSTENILLDFFRSYNRIEGKNDIKLLLDQIGQIQSCNPDQFEASTSIGDAKRIRDYMSDEHLYGFEDPILGLTTTSVNYNSSMPIHEMIKRHRDNKKDKDKKSSILKALEKMNSHLPSTEKIHANKNLIKVNDIILDSISVQLAGMTLLKDSSLRIVKKRKYGLIGRNGVGKSSLLRALVRREIPGIHPDISIGCIEQDLILNDTTILQCVLDVDTERSALLKEAEQIQNEPLSEKNGNRMAMIYDRLNEIEADLAPEQAQEILIGLGIPIEMQSRSVMLLSGGERMRVALARALFADPDILFLDEPSNHLDLHAIAWLTQYLKGLKKSVIIVSHARQLLNDVCTDIILFANKSLQYFKGNYDDFEKDYATQIQVENRKIEAQEIKQKHMEEFINRFRYNAKRASLVQSRLKMLARLPLIERVIDDPTIQFNFNDVSDESLSPPILQMDNVSFSYNVGTPEEKVILKNVNFSVSMDSKIAICGVNGSGKTTLLSLLTQSLEPTSGVIHKNNKLRIGIYTQEHIDQLDFTLTAVQQLQERYPEANLSNEEARTFLGKFGITQRLAIEPLFVLSGGQKSRVCIAIMAFKNPNLLILDEPTNHLDMDAIQALLISLKTFAGGVVIVSHDAFFLENLCEEIWHVHKSTSQCEKISNSFKSYWAKFLSITKADKLV